MALRLGALREALIDAGASPDKAAKASEEVAGYESRLAKIEGMLTPHSWMLSFNLALTLAILWRVFAH